LTDLDLDLEVPAVPATVALRFRTGESIAQGLSSGELSHLSFALG
jgi:hypothetical protein